MLATRARDSLPQTPSSGERFGHVVAVIAAGGALAGWIAVVGAVREYARFDDAGIPSPAQTASLFPREALLGEGLTTVAPIIGIAFVVSILSYVSLRALCLWQDGTSRLRRRSVWDRREPRRLWLLFGPGLVIAICTGGLVIALVVSWRVLLLLPGVLLIAGLLWWVGAVATPSAAAMTVFTALVFCGGITVFWAQLEEPNPTFDSVTVTRHHLEPITGFYLTRSGGNVYVAVLPRQARKTKPRFAVVSIPESQVELISLGPEYQVTRGTVVLPSSEASKPPAITRAPEPGSHSEHVPVTITEEEAQPQITTTAPTTASTRTTPAPTIPSTPTPAPVAERPAIQTFALDEVVPARDHFCFPVGSGQAAETLALTFTAARISSLPFYRTRFTLGTSTMRLSRVPITPSMLATLREDEHMTVHVAIAATAGHAKATAAYVLELQDPGGQPLGPGAPSWEPKSSEKCGP